MKTKPKSKSPRRPAKVRPRRSNLRAFNVKFSPDTRRALQAAAKKFAKGNLSAWLRHAGLSHTPRKGEKVDLRAT